MAEAANLKVTQGLTLINNESNITSNYESPNTNPKATKIEISGSGVK